MNCYKVFCTVYFTSTLKQEPTLEELTKHIKLKKGQASSNYMLLGENSYFKVANVIRSQVNYEVCHQIYCLYTKGTQGPVKVLDAEKTKENA